MKAGEFNRRVQFRRATPVDDGLQIVEHWADHGSLRWAARRDISDAERVAAGWVEATLASRFTVRSTDFTRGLSAKDRLICDAVMFDITGIKEIGRRNLLEITAVAKVDR